MIGCANSFTLEWVTALQRVVIGSTLALSACGSNTPTAPTPTPVPPPVVASPLPPSEQILHFSIYGDEWVYLGGQGQQYTVRIDLKSGENPIYDTDHVTWTVEPATVATIDARGKLTPIAIGQATVTARTPDRSGQSRIRVLPDYAGEWNGTFEIPGCTGGFDFRECGRLEFGLVGNGPGVRAKYPFTVSLSKFRGDVTGSIRESRASGDLTYPVTGFVRDSGDLVLEAIAPQSGNEPLRIFNWSSRLANGVGAMSGAFTKIEPKRGPFGEPYTIRTEHEFTGLSRTR